MKGIYAMWRSNRQQWTKAMALGLAISLARSLAPGGASAGGFFGPGFEEFTGIPAEAVTPLAEEELEELRGGFLGFYFSVTLAGFAEAEGVLNARLDVTAGLGDQFQNFAFEADSPTSGPAFEGGSLGGPSVLVKDNVTGEAFRIQSTIGDAFQGASGAFQISQIPGSGNSVGQTMILNLAVLQATESNLGAVRERLGSLFGLR